MESLNSVNYKRIYYDLLSKKFPDKMPLFLKLMNKDPLTALDIIEFNGKIFSENIDIYEDCFNQRHKSYQKTDILRILEYQKKHNLTNSQISQHFRISRNTISKWRRLFADFSY